MINKMYIFKFKYCYKSKHYALILSQEHNKYKYLTLTHKNNPRKSIIGYKIEYTYPSPHRNGT